MNGRSPQCANCKAAAFSFVLLLIAGLFFSGCSGSGGAPTKETLSITFSPNPAHLEPNGWSYRVYVAETSGVGVFVASFSTETYSTAGVLTSRSDFTSATFELWFRSCGWSENYIPGGETRCTGMLGVHTRNTGYVIWTLRGINDLGEDVFGEGRVELL